MKITIEDVTICDERSPWHLKNANVILENGVISYVGSENRTVGTKLDGKGKWLTPGWFDMWANFCDPGYEQKEDLTTGSSAAMSGGFTGVALLPNTDPVTQTKNNLKYISTGNNDRITRLFPLAAVTMGATGTDITEMIDLFENGAAGFTNGENPVMSSGLLMKTLQYLQKFDGLLLQRPADADLSKFGMINEGAMSVTLGMPGMPSIAEELIIKRDLDLLEYAGGRIHFSLLSTAGSVDIIRKARQSGLQVSCSMAAYQPLLTEDEMKSFDTNLKVNPPLRTVTDNDALVEGLKDGTITVIVTAHNPQDTESKALEFDLAEFGMIGLQTAGPNLAALSEKVPMEVLLRAVTLGPREELRIDVPAIDEGSPVDVTLLDPNKKWTFDEKTNFSKSENSAYFGQELTGCVELTARGKMFWHNPLFT